MKHRSLIIKELDTKYTFQKYWNAMFWSFSSIILRFSISIGSSIVFVRYLGDNGYGSVIVMADFVTIAIVILSQGLGIVQNRIVPQLFVRKCTGQIKDFYIKTVTVRIFLSIIVPAILYQIRDVVHFYIFSSIDIRLFNIALMLIPIQMIVTCFRGMLEVTYNQKDITICDISGLILRLSVAAPVILFDYGILWFFLTQLVTDLFLAIFYGVRIYFCVWRKIAFEKREKYEGRIWSSGLIMMFVLLSSRFLGKEMDTQILSIRLGESALPEVTVYSICYVLVARIYSFIGSGSASIANLNQVLMAQLSESRNTKVMKNLYWNQIQIYYFISIPIFFGGSVIAEQLLTIMYGKSFVGRGSVCAILFLIIGGTVINDINYPIIFSFGKEKFMLIERTVFGIVNVFGSYIMADYGALGVVIATGVCLFSIAITETIFVHKLLSPKFPVVFLVKVSASSAIMFGILNIVQSYLRLNNEVINLIITILLGIIVFYTLMLFLKPFDRKLLNDSKIIPKKMGNFFWSISR